MIEIEKLIQDRIMAEICATETKLVSEDGMKIRHGIQGSYLTIEGSAAYNTHRDIIDWCRDQDVEWETIAEKANYRLILIRDKEAATLCYLANR